MCLYETCSEVHMGKQLSDAFCIQHSLKRDALPPLRDWYNMNKHQRGTNCR